MGSGTFFSSHSHEVTLWTPRSDMTGQNYETLDQRAAKVTCTLSCCSLLVVLLAGLCF